MSRSLSRWQVVEETTVVENRFLRVAHRQVSYQGGEPMDFLVVHDPDYIQVAAITPDNQAVLIIQDHVAEGLSVQLIAGNTRGFNSPDEAAARELGEEGGWRAEGWVNLGIHVPQTDRIISTTPGTDGAKRCTMFLATGLRPTEQKLEPGEKIRVVLVPWDQVVQCALLGTPVPGVGLPILDCGSRLAIILADRFIHSLPPRF